jgi:hypothetical protein
MKIIIKTVEGIKTFNGQKINDIISKMNSDEKEYSIVKSICEDANSEEDLILGLRKLSKITTPASLLLCIKILGNLSLTDAYPIFDQVMSEN